MDKNTLENIQHTNTISYTMINGRLYDTSTMNEIGNYNKKRSSFYWESGNYNQGVPLNLETNGFTVPTCSCH